MVRNILKKFTFFSLLLKLLISVGLAQTPEKVKIVVSDPNNDLVSIGTVFLIDLKGNKIAVINLEKINPSLDLQTGNYTLEIQSPGFKPYLKTIKIIKGLNIIEAKLDLAEISIIINAEESKREKRLNESMGGYLTESEIASLPESGEDIREELQKRYGDDILIRIDGDFSGSQIPSREQISSVKVISNTFDAEFHEIGRTVVDIRTKVIANSFHGFGSLSFNNSNLNARNPFALQRQPTRSNNLLILLSGPLIKKKASFNFSTIRFNRVTTQNFNAKGFVGNVVPQQIENNLALTTFSINPSLPKKHLLNLKYENTDTGAKNVGLSLLDLPGRGSNRNGIQHKFSIIESGTFKNKYVNDLRFEFSRTTDETTPNAIDTTILVLGAFNAGSSGININTLRNKISLTDNLLFDKKNHSLKIGIEFEYEQLHTVSKSNVNGTFTFLNSVDFNNQKPAQYSQTIGLTEYELSQLRGALYFQDYFKLAKTFQLSLGLRYEKQNYLSDTNNVSPRLGYAWSFGKNGKFIIRGGTGVFYDWLGTNILSAILSNSERQGQRIIIKNPSFSNPLNGENISQILPPSISKLDVNLTTPYIFIIQNGFNYKLTKPIKFEGIYTLRKGLHHFRSRNINAPLNGIIPNPMFGIIQLLESSGVSQEQTLELKLSGHYKKINMFGNYKLSNSKDDFSNALDLPMDNYNLRLERGVSNLNQPHILNLGFDFDVLNTINISTSFRLESNFPYTITTGKDDNNDSVFNDRPLNTNRNTEYGERLKTIDVRFRWKVPIKFSVIKDKIRSLNLNVNARNLLNSTNLTNYIGIQTSPLFNTATSARNARSFDFGLSFGF